MSHPFFTLTGMFCLNCGEWLGRSGAGRAARGFCRRCAARLRRAGPALLPGGLRTASAFRHQGPARRAVHILKYRGVDAAAAQLAGHLAELLPPGASALVPVPRPAVRRLAYGTDPGPLLARALGREVGLPVAEVLRASPLRRSQVRRRSRCGARFRLAAPFPERAVLVDDVLTSGATLQSAFLAGGGKASGAVTVTRAPRPPVAGPSPSGAQPATGGMG